MTKDYDYANALYKRNIEPGSDNHYHGIDPETGTVLKSKDHETFYKTREYERMLGNVVGDVGGQTHSIPTKHNNLSGQANIFKTLANATHGFANHKTTDDERIAFLSTVLNRFDSGRSEFGIDGNIPQSIEEVVFSNKSPYFEIKGKNERYNNAAADNVQSYNNTEKDFKRTLQLAGGMMRGTIERKKGLFIMTDEEMASKRKKGSDFDMSKVEAVEKNGKYTNLDYKKGK